VQLLSLITMIAAVQAQPDSVRLTAGARTPAFAPDGRMAVAIGGDLWVIPAGDRGGRAARVTSGPAWDRDPAWARDGASIVFASDRAGTLDLWRVAIGPVDCRAATATCADGSVGEPVRLTTSDHPDSEPSVAPDGSTVFVRGRGSAADLWVLRPDGREERLTSEPGAEQSPAYSPDGAAIAYVAEREAGPELRIRRGGEEQTIVDDRPVRSPVWAPDGGRLAFSTAAAGGRGGRGGGRGGRGGRGGGGNAGGIYVVPTDGSYMTLAARETGRIAWSPDGVWIAVADDAGGDLGYNGDPDRLGDRAAAGDLFRTEDGRLRLARAPAAPDPTPSPLDVSAVVPRSDYNVDAFERVFERVTSLYLEGPGHADGRERWARARDRLRPRAAAARDSLELETVIHELLAQRPPLRSSASGRAAVSSANPFATAAGVEILAAGGNVVDAAVAVSFALGVVEPDASGPGGYGEMLIHVKGMTEPVAIEFMTRLPEAVNSYEPSGTPHGAQRVNVPGTIAGMELAWKKFGSGNVTWARIVEPAIRLAEQGFPIDDGFATTLSRERDEFAQHESSRALFFRDGHPLQAGDTLRNPDLAWTLRQVAEQGADAFYRGDVAQRLVNDLRAHGNPITLADMSRYFAAERRPVRTTYRGHAVYSGPPPVTGGASLAGKLNLLELAPRGRSMTDDPVKLHAMIEAWKFQPSTGNRVADPDLWPVDVTPFESKDTARVRWRCFDPEQAGSSGALSREDCGDGAGDDIAPASAADHEMCAQLQPADRECRSTGTTAFAVADADGNAVSVTQTLGTWGGNFYVTPGLGFLYNDKFNSYRSDPASYGGRVPFGRNTTVIAPTIVYDGDGANRKPLLAAGAAGNAWITSAVYAMVVGVIDHDLGPQQLLELPRMLPGGSVQIEDGFSPAAIRALEEMGHSFRLISLKGELRMGYGAAVLIRDGRATAGADPRRAGAAGATR
jgi:gamma-glutamyltranspeptidase